MNYTGNSQVEILVLKAICSRTNYIKITLALQGSGARVFPREETGRKGKTTGTREKMGEGRDRSRKKHVRMHTH